MFRAESGSGAEGISASKRPRPRPTSRVVVIESESESEGDGGAAPSSQVAQEDEPALKRWKGKMVVEVESHETKVRRLLVGIGKARKMLDKLAEALEVLESTAKELV